ncbi:MAG: DUF2267 domain-containing protein [Alphaproteobacteria bacterium]|jgi:uncharacterized protein (DUF2267 family)|nr:DUF2267 domain-containing protein [Alphaproteobacteria bacterium]MBU0802382.1 DUF2267 domain-containing protein [Alphaproteobacteria bacterium]MBU0870176.1 DUF2267 domain-containing protein [Alphaproteobacteria bacterium]MBU1399881.1 DUF2267 domain-containing protein [Alphaproteobacteria bacterium]MBU1590267.1 DUF2267 domain-containing protein [Alphaproteobacteria bacterium]
MTHTGITKFTHAAEQAQAWVNEIADDLGWNESRAYLLLRSVLHALRDWLEPEEMADLSAQLPLLVRGIYFEGWKGLEPPTPDRSKQAFVERVAADFANKPPEDPESAIAAVFRLLDRHLSAGEIVQVRGSMRMQLRHLWPAH